MRSPRLLALGFVATLVGCFANFPLTGAPGEGGPAPQGPVFGTVVDAQGKPAASVTVKAYLASSTPLNNSSPLVGNAGAGLVGNAGSGLVGNTGGSLTDFGGAGFGPGFLAERTISAAARRLAAGVEVRTDAAGRFALTPTQAGTYNVEAVENAKSKAWKAAVSYSGSGQSAEVGKLGLAPTGQISGKVRSTIATVSDFANTSVYIPGSGYIAITRSDGTYTIPDVPAGTFDLAAFNNELGDGKLPDQDNPGLVRVVSGETTSAAPLVLKTTPPEITSITRAESLEVTDNGAPGTAIDIHGKFFGFNRGVRFEVRFAAETGLGPDRLSEDLIRVKVPGAALNGNLQVFVGGLQSTNVKTFRVMKALTTSKQSLSLAAGAEHDFGADVTATDTKGDPIVEIVENGVTKLARPNITWLVDNNKGFVSERGVFKALAQGSVVVSARAGELPGFTIPVTITSAGGAEPTPAPTGTPSPGASETPTPAPSQGVTPTPATSATPTSAPSPTTAPTPTPSPTPSPTPVATPTPNWVSTLAGGGSGDGFGTSAGFYTPTAITYDGNGTLYVAEYSGADIRSVTLAGMVGTLAGGNSGYNIVDGPAGSAVFYQPSGVAFSQGAVYVADKGFEVIRKIAGGQVSTYAGSKSGSYADGPALEAKFRWPAGIAADGNGNLYVADTQYGYIRKIDQTGYVSTIAGSGSSGFQNGEGSGARFQFPQALIVGPDGNIYVADKGNHVIRKVTPAGFVSTYAGSGAEGSANGPATTASFDEPYGLAFDAAGNLYVADRSSHLIRKVAAGGGEVVTYAGSIQGLQNGPRLQAKFSSPAGVTVGPDGEVYVADYGNNRIRVIR